ncbi:transcriptional regulator [Sulfuriflexus mobilis]|uniref:transcriptional regulator n=1 Tax=Sulfuriflexus mobilis TaxID=1811807 RepID=UPI000F827E82|nr:transcriptional regulator [Sulfuriflexus mobilis]
MSAAEKKNIPVPAVERAKDSWGDEVPYWVAIMAEQCDHSSQKRVADKIGYSPAVVSNVLANKYSGDLGAVEQSVNGALLMATVNCPVVGTLKAHHCLENQRRNFSLSNPQRVRLYKACRSGHCPHSRLKGEES